MQRNWLVWLFAALVLAVLAYAWIDGGREPMREMAQPIAVPEQSK